MIDYRKFLLTSAALFAATAAHAQDAPAVAAPNGYEDSISVGDLRRIS